MVIDVKDDAPSVDEMRAAARVVPTREMEALSDKAVAPLPAPAPEPEWTFTLLMRSAHGSAVAVVPGFPTREAAERAGRIAEGNPNIDEWGEPRESEVVSSATQWQRRWVDIAILPVPK